MASGRITRSGAEDYRLTQGLKMYRRRSHSKSLNNCGLSINAACIIKELVFEIQCLQRENIQLRCMFAAPVRRYQRTKRCYRCGREGHLERACCEKVSRYDGNWRTTKGGDSGPVTDSDGSDSVDEGFGSPGILVELSDTVSEQIDVSHTVVQNEVIQLGDDQLERDSRDGGSSSCARARIYKGKCDQEAGGVETYSGADNESDESSSGDSDEDSVEAATESEGEKDGMFDDAEDVSPPRPRKALIELLEDIQENVANPQVASALGLIGQIF